MKRLFPLMLALLLLTACSASPAPAKPCAEVAQAVLASQPFAESMTQQTEKRMTRALFLEEGMISEGFMSIDASKATAEAVIVLTAASADTLPKVQKALEEYRVSVLTQYRDYRPDEAPKLEAAAVQTRGLQCVLIIAPDQAAARSALDAAWK